MPKKVQVSRKSTKTHRQYKLLNEYYLGKWTGALNSLTEILTLPERPTPDIVKDRVALALNVVDRFGKEASHPGVKAFAMTPTELGYFPEKQALEHIVKILQTSPEQAVTQVRSLTERIESERIFFEMSRRSLLRAL